MRRLLLAVVSTLIVIAMIGCGDDKVVTGEFEFYYDDIAIGNVTEYVITDDFYCIEGYDYQKTFYFCYPKEHIEIRQIRR